ncbi:hypothetical protein B0H11DRAFT_1909673 [Mycena galericulata]|nr:hypothetical protein B0H11DRAFT_1909673 [Mycena galericulata]
MSMLSVMESTGSTSNYFSSRKRIAQLRSDDRTQLRRYAAQLCRVMAANCAEPLGIPPSYGDVAPAGSAVGPPERTVDKRSCEAIVVGVQALPNHWHKANLLTCIRIWRVGNYLRLVTEKRKRRKKEKKSIPRLEFNPLRWLEKESACSCKNCVVPSFLPQTSSESELDSPCGHPPFYEDQEFPKFHGDPQVARSPEIAELY